MTASKSLPVRPSLESLRKQAKKLARDIAAGDACAIARARVQLPHVDLPLTQRNAQLVIARVLCWLRNRTISVLSPCAAHPMGRWSGATSRVLCMVK